jgi:purine-nucleoside phosphorylase
MATPHNSANKGDIAKTVIMSGDPLRIKAIAENYLENYKLVNSIRNIYAYTGTYKGKEVTVMAHGMGIPSMGIYVYELFKEYDVDKIIRLGSCGALTDRLNILDIALVEKSYTESRFAFELDESNINCVPSSPVLKNKIEEVAKNNNIVINRCNALCSDVFDWYVDDFNKFYNRLPKELNLEVAEMESFALFYLAYKFKKQASCVLTVVDSHFKEVNLSAEERQKSLDKMTILALESI